MTFIALVTEKARELVARDFDTRGPDVCMAEIVRHLEQHNPEVLDMATKCAANSGNPAKVLIGLGMFYRLLIVQFPPNVTALIRPPRVSAETRASLVAEIDELGAEAFTRAAIAELETNNPELLQMAHNCAASLENYLHTMQGFGLLYRSLVVQARADRTTLH
jgi:hypothetical protein